MNQQPIQFSEKTSLSLWIGLIVTFFIGACAPRSMAFLPSVLGLGFLIVNYIAHKRFLFPNKKEIFFLGIVILLAFASSFWSPDQNFSFERSIKISTIFIPALFLLSAGRLIKWPNKLPLEMIVVGVYLAVAALLISEKISNYFILESILREDVASHKLNRSFVVFSLFFVPVFFLLKNSGFEKIKKIILEVFVFVLTGVALSLAESQTAQLCFVIGCLFLFLFPAKCRFSLRMLGGTVIILAIALPFLVKPLQATIPEDILMDGILREASIIHRFEVWNHTADQAIKSPLYGQGIEALRFLESSERMEFQEATNVLHAHNAALQIWVEFGLIGIILASFLLFYIFRSIDREENIALKRFYLAVFMSVLCCSMTGYGLWQGWQLGLFFLIATTTLAIGKTFQQKT